MKDLKPAKILMLAPPIVGIVLAVIFAICQPDARTPSRLLFSLGLGVLFAFILFAPITAALAFSHRLSPYASRIQWYTSLLMCFALGYVMACARYSAFDNVATAAWFVIFLGATVKTTLGVAFRQSVRNVG